MVEGLHLGSFGALEVPAWTGIVGFVRLVEGLVLWVLGIEQGVMLY